MEPTVLSKLKKWLFTGFTGKVLWAVYFSLLMVLYPHTVWGFSIFEPDTVWGRVTAHGAAFAFEAVIAVLVHKLAEHWELLNKRRFKADTELGLWWVKFSHKWLNSYVIGLIFALFVSVAANGAHAVQYGNPDSLKIVSEWGVPFTIYILAFGGMLPFCSLLFARVLSNVNDFDNLFGDSAQNIEEVITNYKQQITSLQTKFTAMKTKYEQEITSYQQRITDSAQNVNHDQQRVAEMEQTINQLRQQVASIGELGKLIGDDVSTRIITAKQLWPELSNRSLATVCQCSPTYVGKVLGGE